MILGTVLLFVGAVLFINGLAMLGKIQPREAAVMNILSGGICLFASCYNIFATQGEPMTVRDGTYGLLFAFTYLWVAYNFLSGADGRGLGWFSLFVAITAVPITWDSLVAAKDFFDYWMVYCWGAWAVLWFSFFLLGVCGKNKWAKPVACLALFQAVTTAWLPGYLLLSGHMPN